MKFLEPTKKPKVFYSDNSLEFGKSCEALSWNHSTSTPHRSETNGIAGEQCAEKKKAPLPYCCNQAWMKIGGQIPWNVYTYLRNVTDLLSDGKTPCERRFGQPFKGPIIPFGSLVE